MQDLSNLFVDGPVAALCPTNQHAGNRPSNQGAAQTAPGSESPSVDVGEIAQAPYAQALDHARTTVTDGNEPPNPTRFTGDSGGGWSETDATDVLPENQGRPRITPGRWNSI